MQMLILAGGLGTRLRPLTERMPKCMVPADGKPFLEHQLRLLASRGVRDIVLCLGYLGERVLEYFGNGHRFGVNLAYAWERDGLLGTAGAIRNAEALLAPEFFVAYGDSYLLLDYRAIMTRFRRSDALGMMVVYHNEDRLVRSDVVMRDGHVLGSAAHLVLDQMWTQTDTLFWPLKGLSFQRQDISRWLEQFLEQLRSDPYTYISEAAGAVVVLALLLDLRRRHALPEFLRSGRMGPSSARRPEPDLAAGEERPHQLQGGERPA